jgi:hypothetical protein
MFEGGVKENNSVFIKYMYLLKNFINVLIWKK